MEGLPQVTERTVDIIVTFIRDSVNKSGTNGVVVGLSGGLDSAVVSKLAVMALGPDKVLNVFMPSDNTPVSELVTVTQFSDELGTELKSMSIQPVMESFVSVMKNDSESPLEMGNLAARSRMVILYNLAKKRNSLVIGTSNRSEMMMGYFTKYGDGACDILPLADLFKTQVKELASLIGIPSQIISKPPSAGFWEGQTDEGEMNIRYDVLDRILQMFLDGITSSEISSTLEIPETEVVRVLGIVDSSSHKRYLPLRPLLGSQKGL